MWPGHGASHLGPLTQLMLWSHYLLRCRPSPPLSDLNSSLSWTKSTGDGHMSLREGLQRALLQWHWRTSIPWRRTSSWHPGKDPTKGSLIPSSGPRTVTSLTHNCKAPLSCQWSSRDRSNCELTAWWTRPYKFLIKGKKCQNADEGKQKEAIAVRTIADSTYERVVWSPLMIFLCHFTYFFISVTKDVLYQLGTALVLSLLQYLRNREKNFVKGKCRKSCYYRKQSTSYYRLFSL